MPIMDICGDLGTGKTLFLTMCLYEDYKNQHNIMSNYGLKFKHEMVNPMELMNFGDINNVSLGLDEAWTFLDSRINTRASRLATYFFLQSRKKRVKVYYTAQLRGSVDKRLRNLADRTVLCEVIGSYEQPEGFIYTVFNHDEIVKRLRYTLEQVEPYFHLYDTTELIYPMELLGFYDVKLEDIKELFLMSEKKGTFRTILRGEYPTITIDTANAVYDLLKMGSEKADNRIRRLLRIDE